MRPASGSVKMMIESTTDAHIAPRVSENLIQQRYYTSVRVMMELKNLDKNILYRICEELTRKDRCGPLKAKFIYQIFSDLPDEKIAEAIRSLVNRGWLREDRHRTRLFLTDRGRSEIRSFIPAKLLASCQKPTSCRED
jgi:hypothetical protein